MLLVLCSVTSERTACQDGDPYRECVIKPDGALVSLPRTGDVARKSGKSFAIKEWFAREPAQPRIVVVVLILPVKEYWCGYNGRSAYRSIQLWRRKVIVVSPENVMVPVIGEAGYMSHP